MEFSLPGLIGAFIGIVLGVINYAVVVSLVEARLRALDKSQTAEEKAEFERKISLMRKLILGIEVAALGAIGYWLGRTIGG